MERSGGSRYLTGKSVYIGQNSRINDALRRGGVAVVRLYYEPFEETGIRMVSDHPFAYNRIVPEWYFNRETRETYALGPYDGREAVLLFNERTRLTEEKTIEYFI